MSLARNQEFADKLAETIQTAALAVLPLAAVTLVLRREIVSVVLQRGNFGPTETNAVAQVLIYLMPALVAWAMASATAIVPLSKGLISKAPTGPFHRTVFACVISWL